MSKKRRNKPVPLVPQQAVPVTFIDNLEDLPFNLFISCMCDRKYGVLALPKCADDNPDAFRAWLHLLSEYYTAIGSAEIVAHIELVTEMEFLNSKLIQVSALVACLRVNLHPDLVECMAKWGYPQAFSEESVDSDLDTIERWLSSDRLKLGMLKQQYEDAEEKRAESGETEAQRSDYIRSLLAIASFRKVTTIRPAEINTLEYCLMVKELQDYNKEVEKISHGK